MRKELRAMLKWCLAQPGKFRNPEAMAHFNAKQASIGKKLRSLEALGYLEREVVSQHIHYFKVTNREEAVLVANTESIHKHQAMVRKPRIKRKTSTFARVNSIFSAAQQL